MSLLNRKSDQSSDDKKILEEILKRENLLEKRKLELDAFERELKRNEKNLEEREEELTSNLQKSSKLTSDEARKLVIDKWEQKLQKDIAEEIKAAQEKAQQEAKAKAQEILVDAMKHAATDYVRSE